ncbi:MAG: ATPase, T2SS/T4P/T4SS family, partial [Candidatus Omnitrophota bacterium]
MGLSKNILLGQILVERGYLKVSELDRALKEHDKTGDFLGVTLVKLGMVDEEVLMPVLSEQLGIKYVKIKEHKIDQSVVEKVPAKFASHYKMMPIRFERGALMIGVCNPLDIHTIDDIRLLLSCEVEPVLCGTKDIADAIRKYYGIGAETLERMNSGTTTEEAAAAIEVRGSEDIESMAEDASIIKFVNQIILGGYQDRATDIHIEPYENELSVRYRIDGVLHSAAIPPSIKQFQAAIISRIKIMANLNIAERRLPQDGRIKARVGEHDLDLRVSILPTPYGEGIDIRVLSNQMLDTLESLGLMEDHRAILEMLIKKPHGIVFVTGPTGSGKTTTLYVCLNQLNKKELKIITVEDPIEYQMSHVTQIQVMPRIGLTFATGLRSILRHDPDILMVGEVRDYETAEITIRSSLTGHLVFSTIHTNDAAGGITRLLDMGIEPYVLRSGLLAILNQRLLRRLCSCAEPSDDVEARLGLAVDRVMVPRGCPDCG